MKPNAIRSMLACVAWLALAGIGIGIGIGIGAGAAQAATVLDDTTSGYAFSYAWFGDSGSHTIGQVITAPAGETSLDSFSLFVSMPTTVVFRGELYAWDGNEASGSALFESEPRQTSGDPLGDYEE